MIIKTCIFILLVSTSQIVNAACETDRFGEVYCGRGGCALDKKGNVFCSKYIYGKAVVDSFGVVVCGKSQCLSNVQFNEYYCSTIEGGGAKLDRFGAVKCYGGCEKATPAMCESEKGK